MAASPANSVHSIRSVATLSGIPTRSHVLGGCSTSSSSSVFLGSKHGLCYYGFIRRAELFHALRCSAKRKSCKHLQISFRNFPPRVPTFSYELVMCT